MDDPKKSLPALQELVSDQVGSNWTKNSSLKFRIKIPMTLNGFFRIEGKEKEKEKETHLDQKDQNSAELKNCLGKLKNHLLTSSMEENKNHTEVNSERTACNVCGKNFSSTKSLHGHMRLHPERRWRGIEPPCVSDSRMVKGDSDQEQNSPSSSESSDIDRLPLFSSWSATGLRGRKSAEQRQGDEVKAVSALLMLPDGNSLDLANQDYIATARGTVGALMLENVGNNEQVLECSELPMKRRKEGLETEYPEFQCKKAKIHKENESGLISKLVKMDSTLEIPNGFEVENRYAVQRIPSNSMPLKSEFLMTKLCELGKMNYNETSMSPNRFICNICNKSFSTHQALGGHKSGHKNDKNGIHNADAEKLTRVDESQEFIPSILKHNVGTHQCKICNKTFPTGQALGGHQRLHRPIPTLAPINSDSTSEQIVKGSPTCSVSSPEKIMKEYSISSVTPPEKLIEESSTSSASSPERIIFKEPSITSVALLEEVMSCKTNGNRMVFDLNEPPPLDYDCFN